MTAPQESLQLFAQLGRRWRAGAAFVVSEFSELVITEPSVLRDLQRLLESETGDLQRVYEVTLDDGDTFRGRADQRISLGRSQTYQFTITPEQMIYRLVNGDEVARFAESDEGWAEITEFAAKSSSARAGKKLNCKPGNVQCGGKCQSGNLNCFAGMTPAQKKAAQAATKKARASAPASTSTSTSTSTPAPAPQSPPSTPVAASASPTASASPVKLNTPELDQSRSELVNRFGAKLVSDAEKNVQRILDDADVFVRIKSSSTLEQILSDRFKTAHELGRTDHQIPYLRDDYLTARARVEAKTLGYSETGTAPGDRPIYAYMGGKDMSGDSHAHVAQAYGSIAVKLKPEVKERTTFTGADSFKSGIASEVINDGDPPPPNAASLVATTRHGFDRSTLPSNYPSYYADNSQDGSQLRGAAKAKTIDDLAPKLAPTGNAYVEAQVHGQVKATDIAEIHFTPSGVSDRPTPAIAKFAQDNGVDLYVSGRKLTPQEITQISNPPADRRSQRVRDLADALDKGDVETVVRLADDLGGSASQIDLNPGERDRVLKHLRSEAGYDGLPTVGTDQDVTNTWKSGGVLMVRGDQDAGSVTGAQILQQFQTGDFHTGNGIYGNGTYVGHAGKFVRGQYVGHDPQTEAKDAKRAVQDVAKHGYISARTTITRMALTNDAVVARQSDLLSERNRIKRQLTQWADTERNKLTAGARVYTDADERAYNKRYRAEKSSHDPDTPTITPGTSRKMNGGLSTRADETWEFPSKTGGAPLQITVVRHSSPGRTVFTLQDAQGKPILDDRGNAVFLQASSRNKNRPSSAAIATIYDQAATQATLRALNLTQYPAAGKINDPVVMQRVADLDARVRRTREVLGVDDDQVGGSVERLAILRGVDAIALDNSYEPNTFMNLLNRSKVVVQQNPLSWTRARKTGVL